MRQRLGNRISTVRATGLAQLRAKLARRTVDLVRRTQAVRRIRALLRSLGLGRVLCWQLVMLSVLAASRHPRPALAAVTAVAVAVVAATTVRVHGLLLAGWLLRACRFLLRRWHTALHRAEPKSHQILDLITRNTRLDTVDIDDAPVAFISQPIGITAVLELQALPGGIDDHVSDILSTPEPLLPPPSTDQPVFTAQLIMQTLPGDARHGNQAPGPRTWITIQVCRTADIYRDADLRAVLVNAVRRLIRRLGRDDRPTRALDRDEALSLIAGLSQIGQVKGERAPIKEGWSSWRAGTTVQACFRIDDWQDASESVRQLALRRLRLVPSRGTTVAIAAQQTMQPTRLVVRITETSCSMLNNSADLLRFAMKDIGPRMRLERLNGDHLAAVAASLPLGGRDAR